MNAIVNILKALAGLLASVCVGLAGVAGANPQTTQPHMLGLMHAKQAAPAVAGTPLDLSVSATVHPGCAACDAQVVALTAPGFKLVYDLPARPARDDFPANGLLAYQRHYDPHFPMSGVKQCGVFALWRVDNARHKGYYTLLISLNRSYKAVHPKSKGVPAGWIDDAARLQHVAVDHTPHIGAIGIMEPGFHGAGSNGHAFYVSAIDSVHHRIRIEEYNGVRPLAYATRVVAWSYASEYVHFKLR